MNVLVLNSGSSSIKYELRDSEAGSVLARGEVGRIGEEGGARDHGRALESILEKLVASGGGPLPDITAVDAVGHRVVHGGSHFGGPALLTPEVVNKIEECAPLAPLHNPPALLGIREALRVLPRTPQVAVFDTAFHRTIPAMAHVYALPFDFYERHGVRRYGFHGISLQSVTRTAGALLGGTSEESKMVVAHLGNGASVTAIDGGRSVDTSMGLTPLEGLVMGTRSGDVDPGVVLYLMRELGLTVADVDRVMNRESGLLGLSGVSNDMRDVLRAAAGGDEPSRLALEIYCYRLRKYIGAYAAAMGGLGVLVFTAGVGENSPDIRAKVCEGLGFLGIHLDAEANTKARGLDADIAAEGSRVRVLVIATDEERVIADETVAVVKGGSSKSAGLCYYPCTPPATGAPKERKVMEFTELLAKRYAAKLFQPKAVPEETMQELLEMIRLAPSGLNIQPWRIKVVGDAGTKARLLALAPDEPQIGSCSHLLVFCADTDWAAQMQRLGRTMKERTIPDKIWGIVMGIAAEMAQEPEDELRSWIIGNVFIAATYGILGAQALGLDSCPMTHFPAAEYARTLELPANIVPVLLLAVGHAADESRPKWRYSLEDILL